MSDIQLIPTPVSRRLSMNTESALLPELWEVDSEPDSIEKAIDNLDWEFSYEGTPFWWDLYTYYQNCGYPSDEGARLIFTKHNIPYE